MSKLEGKIALITERQQQLHYRNGIVCGQRLRASLGRY